MAKKISYGEEAVDGLYQGVLKLSDAVKRTLGAKGSFVLIDSEYVGHPYATKDGVTVAQAVELTDHQESQGSNLMKHVAKMTNEEVGDGTTTSIVLAEALIRNGKAILGGNTGKSAVQFVYGMNKATEAIVDHLTGVAVSVKDNPELLGRVSRISANNDEVLGDLVINAFNSVGTAGLINVNPSPNGKNYILVEKGYKMGSGLMSHYFLPPTKQTVELTDPSVIITNMKIDSMKVLAECTTLNNKLAEGGSVVLICNEIDESVFHKITMSFIKNGVKLYLVKSPTIGLHQSNELSDVATVTGGKFIDQQAGMTLEDLKEEDFGTCKSLILSLEESSFIEGAGEQIKIDTVISELTTLLDDDVTDDREETKRRRAKLKGGVAQVYIDSTSDVEYREVLDRLEDAINATKVAYESGIVAGGGIALMKVPKDLEANLAQESKTEDELLGIHTVFNSLAEPFKVMLFNAGLDSKEYLELLKEHPHEWVGVNCMTGKIKNLKDEGVIDPLKVTVTALTNAVKVAGIILNTSCTITYKED